MFRYVKDYDFVYSAFTKERWLGKRLLDALVKDFKAFDKDYYVEAIESGRITINGKKVTGEYELQPSDFLEHRTTRIEMPVYNQEILVLENTDDYIVVNKPPSIPIHCCGAYNKNSMIFILQHTRPELLKLEPKEDTN